MEYVVSTVQLADIPRLAEIQWAALSTNALTTVMYPRGATSKLMEYTIQSYKRTYTFPSVKLVKATNTATGEIVGFAKWVVYRRDDKIGMWPSVSEAHRRWSQTRRDSGWKRNSEVTPSMPPDCHGTLLERWGEVIHKTRKGISGDQGHACTKGLPCSLECYLSSFADNLWVMDLVHVIPLYQAGGIGSFLIDWGLEQADKEDATCYVEASPVAAPLCLKKGFRHIGEMRIELAKYKDGCEPYEHKIMIRPPKPTIQKDPDVKDPFSNPRPGSISPIEDEAEPSYTAEAKLLHFVSKSSLRSVARLTDARGSKRSLPLANDAEAYRDIPAPIPKGPSVTKLLN